MNNPAAKGASIVIVDNEPELCEVIRLALEDEGYRPSICTDARTALARIEAERPDLVITDWQLFDRATSMRIFDIIRSNPRTAHLPVLICSAAADAEQKRESLSNQLTALLLKPFELEELIALVHRMTGTHSDKGEVTAH